MLRCEREPFPFSTMASQGENICAKFRFPQHFNFRCQFPAIWSKNQAFISESHIARNFMPYIYLPSVRLFIFSPLLITMLKPSGKDPLEGAILKRVCCTSGILLLASIMNVVLFYTITHRRYLKSIFISFSNSSSRIHTYVSLSLSLSLFIYILYMSSSSSSSCTDSTEFPAFLSPSVPIIIASGRSSRL